jgi:glycosyltransferase involved in cell wall biosynthesis
MNFIHLTNTIKGGAGIAVKRLHLDLKRLGSKSSIYVLDQSNSGSDVIVLESDKKFFRTLCFFYKIWLKFVTNSKWCFYNQNLSLMPNWRSFFKDRNANYVIVVHSISHFLNVEQVVDLAKKIKAPVIWNLLDMGLMTGGCHYSWGCNGYKSNCQDCPAIKFQFTKRAPFLTLNNKLQEFLTLKNTCVIAGSSWLANQAKESTLFKNTQINTLLPGISSDRQDLFKDSFFSARLKSEIAGRKVIFIGAQKISDPRKGMAALIEALALLAQKLDGIDFPILLVAGQMGGSEFSGLPFHVVKVGKISEDDLAACYAAADVFACPSIEDSGPMMILESISLGVPVVAFRMGCSEDVIYEGCNGYIAPLGNVEAFADGLRSVLSWSEVEISNSKECSNMIYLSKFAAERQAIAFLKIAEDLNLKYANPS